MFYAKSTGGFYSTEIHGDSIPSDAVEITDQDHMSLLDGQAQGKMIAAGEDGIPFLKERTLPAMDPVAANTAAIQRELDRQAQLRGYDSVFTAITYAGDEELADPMQSKFQAEGNAFKAWRSAVWAHAYSVLDEVQAGTADMPTPEEAVAMMPALCCLEFLP